MFWILYLYEFFIDFKKNRPTLKIFNEYFLIFSDNYYRIILFLGGRCEEGQRCDSILDELENIDDELDETGMVFVTTEDTSLAKKHGVKSFPSLVLFRNKEPLMYKGWSVEIEIFIILIYLKYKCLHF